MTMFKHSLFLLLKIWTVVFVRKLVRIVEIIKRTDYIKYIKKKG